MGILKFVIDVATPCNDRYVSIKSKNDYKIPLIKILLSIRQQFWRTFMTKILSPNDRMKFPECHTI